MIFSSVDDFLHKDRQTANQDHVITNGMCACTRPFISVAGSVIMGCTTLGEYCQIKLS